MKTEAKLELLRQSGYKVKIAHLRIPDGYDLKRNNRIKKLSGVLKPKHELKKDGLTPSPKGGATMVSIWSPRGEPLAEYTEFCSVEDNFVKKVGYTLAVGLAFKSWGRDGKNVIESLKGRQRATRPTT